MSTSREEKLVEKLKELCLCPLTLELPERAVLARDGFVYDVFALERWILTLEEEGKPKTSPMTRLDLESGTPAFEEELWSRCVPMEAVVDALRDYLHDPKDHRNAVEYGSRGSVSSRRRPAMRRERAVAAAASPEPFLSRLSDAVVVGVGLILASFLAAFCSLAVLALLLYAASTVSVLEHI